MHKINRRDVLKKIVINKKFLKAAKEGERDLLEILVGKGVDVNYQDDIGYCALAYATENGHDDCVRYLLSVDGIETNLAVDESEDYIGGIPLHIAAFRGYLAIIKMLVEESPEDIDELEYCGYTPLHETVLSGEFEAFKLLLKLGADDKVKTGPDEAIMDIPEGLDTLALILHRSKDAPDKTLRTMKRYLVRHQLSPDSDSDSDLNFGSDSDADSEDDFGSNSDSEINSDIYSDYDFIFGSDFNSNSESDSQDEFSFQNESDVQDNSDNSHQGEMNLKNFKESSESEEKNSQLILSARGVHFYKNQFSPTERLNYKEYSKSGLLTSVGMYSADTHKRAGIDFSLPKLTQENHRGVKRKLDEREETLEYHVKTTKEVLEKLKNTESVKPVLQRGNKTSRNEFSSRLIELIQRYVNSYKTLTNDISSAQTRDPESCRAERTQLKDKILKMLKDNPFVSTSEDIRVGLQYAYAILNYDSEDSYQPRAELSFTLTPGYQPSGYLKHPYLGVIFITLHTKEELDENSESIVDLFSQFEIDTNKGPGTHLSSGYIRALERIFLGGISRDQIYLAHLVRLPNMFYPYRSFIEEKYGMNQEQYEKFKTDLKRFGKSDSETHRMKNASQFYRTQQSIIQTIIDSMKDKLTDKIQTWAKKYNIDVGRLDKGQQFSTNFDFTEKLEDAVAQNAQRREESKKMGYQARP